MKTSIIKTFNFPILGIDFLKLSAQQVGIHVHWWNQNIKSVKKGGMKFNLKNGQWRHSLYKNSEENKNVTLKYEKFKNKNRPI